MGIRTVGLWFGSTEAGQEGLLMSRVREVAMTRCGRPTSLFSAVAVFAALLGLGAVGTPKTAHERLPGVVHGSVNATVTLPNGRTLRVTSGSVACYTEDVYSGKPRTIVINAVGRTTSGKRFDLAAGVEGDYRGPGTYSFSQEGPNGGVSVGKDSGMFGGGRLVVAHGGRAATVSATWSDEAAAMSGSQNITGSVRVSLSWKSCPRR
jgi:hypothetical protein